MNKDNFTQTLSLKDIQVTDDFWKKKMGLVRREVIPYQWEAFNDRVEGAPPSYSLYNFRLAEKLNQNRKLPEEHFQGFVFQDSDFYKWIEAAAYLLAQQPDAELEGLVDGAIDTICGAQQEDGYLNTYFILNGRENSFTNIRDQHELYCFGHLAEAAVAYYQATGKNKLLTAASRYADFLASYFGPGEGKCKGYPGHELAEMALVRLYQVTGEEKYLNLGRFFIDERGKRPYYYDKEHPEMVRKGQEKDLRYEYQQAHLPVREQEEAVGHAVRAVYLYSGMADIARLTGDESLYEACERLWDSIVEEKMYLTGGIGASPVKESFSFPYNLPNDTAYAESCASIGLAFFARRMLEIKPESKYADVLERVVYNGILSGIALDGKSFFYVNPLQVYPEASKKDPHKEHVKPVRQKWFSCACCPPNIARLLASIPTYAYTENETTLFVHLYMGAVLTKRVGENVAEIRIDSEFPWDGRVQLTVRAGKAGDFCLALRIPDWCGDYDVKGAEEAETWQKDGYLYLQKAWGEEDVISLFFPMEVRLVEADSRVREDIGKVAVMRGPLVYCLEEKDNGEMLPLFMVDPKSGPQVEDREICGEKIKGITLGGYRRIPTLDKGLYHSLGDRQEKESVSLRYIPYYTWANRGENEMQVWTDLFWKE